MSSRSRLARIEARRNPPKPPTRTAAQRRARWESRGRIRQNEQQPRAVFLARDFIGHKRLLGQLSQYSAKTLIDAILDTHGGEATELSRVLVEHTIYRAIFDEEPGLEHMREDLPDAWADAFAAADEWRERLLSVPTAQVAAWVRGQRALLKAQATEEQMLAFALKTMEPYGVTEELLERACGPQADRLEDEEQRWVLYSPVADILCSSDWAWDVREKVRTLDASDAASDA